MKTKNINCLRKNIPGLASFTIAFILLIGFGCNSSHYSEEGKKEIDNLQEKYGCFEIVTGTGVQTRRNGTSKKYISINFTECKEALSFDSIHLHPTLRQEILEKIYPLLINTEKYDGINLDFHNAHDTEWGNKSFLYLFDKSSKKLILSDSSYLEKF